MTIRIARELTLPVDVVTQTLAAIGRKGAGKTNLAQLLAEQMLAAGAQVLALDVVGNWWSLRVAGDGRGKGLDIFVLGGEHGDVPLTPEAGARVGRFLAEKRVSAVVDVSHFREGERKRFAAEFAEEFFHRKKTQRSAVHCFVEEAQKFIPQRCGPDETRMLGAFENIVRLGRNYGIGATLVTQRPQSVNKEVLSQVECLCVLQVNGTHERKALEEWVQEAGADRKLVGELPGLARGEGYVWSPSWLRIFERVHFEKKRTFDASATPEVGKASRAATLAAVDVDALRANLAEVVQAAEAEDPKALRRQIAELKRELTKGKGPGLSGLDLKLPKPPRVVERPAISDATLRRFEQAVEQLTGFSGKLVEYAALLQAQLVAARSLRTGQPVASNGLAAAMPPVARTALRRTAARLDHHPPGPRHHQLAGDGESLAAAQRKLLNALAYLEALGLTPADRTQVALFADLSPTAGHTVNMYGRLRSLGLIEYPRTGVVALTEAGRVRADPGVVPQTPDAMHQQLFAKLPAAQTKLLRVLIGAYPEPLDRAHCAQAAGLSPTAGHTVNMYGRLRSLGLIEYPQPGQVVALPVLFLEGR